MKSKALYVARGIVTFADALMRQHHVDRTECLDLLVGLLTEQSKEELYQANR